MTLHPFPDPRLSMLRAMSAYEAATAHLEHHDLGAVVLVFRGLTDEERDLVEDMLLADGHFGLGGA